MKQGNSLFIEEKRKRKRLAIVSFFLLDVLTHRNFSGFVKLADLHTDNFPRYDVDVAIHPAIYKRKNEYAYTICLYINEYYGSPEPLVAINGVLKHFMFTRCAQHRMLEDLLIITYSNCIITS